MLSYKKAEDDPSFVEVLSAVVSVEAGASPNSIIVSVRDGDAQPGAAARILALTAPTPEEATAWVNAIHSVFVAPKPQTLGVAAGTPAIPLAAPFGDDEPTITESQLQNESSTMLSSTMNSSALVGGHQDAAVARKLALVQNDSDVPSAIVLTPPPAPSSWFWANCCAAE
jgi:hypothetical protein